MNGTYVNYHPRLARLDGTDGGKRFFFVAKHQEIGAFIRAKKLKPVGNEHLSWGAATEATNLVPVEDTPLTITARYFPGIPVPHLHWGGHIYLLNRQLEREFSEPLMQRAHEVLSKTMEAGGVPLDTVIALDGLTGGM